MASQSPRTGLCRVPLFLTFQIRTKLSSKVPGSQHCSGGGLSLLGPLPTSEEPDPLIHQLSQTGATNLFCFVQHIGTETVSYYTLPLISLVTSPHLNKFTERAEANITLQGRRLFIYVFTWFHTSLYPRPFQKSFIKSNSHGHSSQARLLSPFPASLIDPHRG